MGIIVGFVAFLLALLALIAAWPLGRVLRSYPLALVSLAVIWMLIGAAMAWLNPIQANQPDTAIWPLAIAGGGVLALVLLAYARLFAWFWRLLKRAWSRR